MVVPLIGKIILFSIAKKVTVFLVAKAYGFPRLYRRTAEANRFINRQNTARRHCVRTLIQGVFRLPRRACEKFEQIRGGTRACSFMPSSVRYSSQAWTASPMRQLVRAHVVNGIQSVPCSSIAVPASGLKKTASIRHPSKTLQQGALGGNPSQVQDSVRRLRPWASTSLAMQSAFAAVYRPVLPLCPVTNAKDNAVNESAGTVITPACSALPRHLFRYCPSFKQENVIHPRQHALGRVLAKRGGNADVASSTDVKSVTEQQHARIVSTVHSQNQRFGLQQLLDLS